MKAPTNAQEFFPALRAPLSATSASCREARWAEWALQPAAFPTSRPIVPHTPFRVPLHLYGRTEELPRGALRRTLPASGAGGGKCLPKFPKFSSKLWQNLSVFGCIGTDFCLKKYYYSRHMLKFFLQHFLILTRSSNCHHQSMNLLTFGKTWQDVGKLCPILSNLRKL